MMAPFGGRDTLAPPKIEVVCLWQLPNDFFELPLAEQWRVIATVTGPAVTYSSPRPACEITFYDETLSVLFFLVTLGVPWVVAAVFAYLAVVGSWEALGACACVCAVLALHPLPQESLRWRTSRLALSLMRYFTFEVLLDRSNPLTSMAATPAVDTHMGRSHLPAMYLACPHGVFNYGAIMWCTISRWIVGWYQYTGAAAAVKMVPGLRYLDLLIWGVTADRKSIVGALRQRNVEEPTEDAKKVAKEPAGDAWRRGGMIGMVPDGILGAFRGREGVDELLIGKKRGLLRICCEEGATVYPAWFFGTTDMLTVVQDSWGFMEAISRKLQAGLLGYYGRWGLPVPRRVAVSVVVAPVKVSKTAAPTAEQVEVLHQRVYGELRTNYDAAKAFAGYPHRTLIVK